MRALLAILLVAGAFGAAWLVLSAGDDPPARTPTARAGDPEPTPTATPARKRTSSRVARARCPAGVSGCRTVRGRVVYVERVDPDGDGDLHVVVSAGSITLPGLTAVDVAPDLRPRRDPRVGDLVAAAGPVQTGSYGQSQIHALVFNAGR